MSLSSAFTYTIVLQIVRLVTGLIRAKAVSTTLGPAGVGIFAQAQNLQMLGIVLGTASIATGYVQRTKHLEGKYSPEYRSEIHGTVFTFLLLSTLASFLVSLLFLEPVSSWAFAANVESGFAKVILLSVPVLAITQGYLEPRLLTLGNFSAYSLASVFGQVVGTAVLLAGLWSGASVNALPYFLLASAVASFLVLGVFLFKAEPISSLLVLRFKWSHLRPILKVSISLIITGVAFYGSSLFLRAVVLHKLGADYAGYIQVPIVLSGYYAPFITHTLWTFYHPKISESHGTDSKLVRSALLFVAYLQPLIALWIMVFPEWIISIIYTADFALGIKTMPLQFFGDFSYFLLTTLSVPILAAGKIKKYTTYWMLFSIIEVILGYYFITEIKLALRSLALAHLIAATFVLVIVFIDTFVKSKYELNLDRRKLLPKICTSLIFLSAGCIALFLFLDWRIRATIALVYTIYLASIKKRQIQNFISNLLNRVSSLSLR